MSSVWLHHVMLMAAMIACTLMMGFIEYSCCHEHLNIRNESRHIVGAVQMSPQGDDSFPAEENMRLSISNFIKYVERAAANETELLVFPEAIFWHWALLGPNTKYMRNSLLVWS